VIATFPEPSRSPIITEPMTAASNIAVPINSALARLIKVIARGYYHVVKIQDLTRFY